MKNSLFQRLRTHVFTLRFVLTVTFLQYLVWVRMTDQRDHFRLFLIFICGVGLASVWVAQLGKAITDPLHRHHLSALGVELIVTVLFLAAAFSTIPLRIGFLLSRPALETFVQKTEIPNESKSLQRVEHQVGLFKVWRSNNSHLLILQGGIYHSDFLIWRPRNFVLQSSHEIYLGHNWHYCAYQGSEIKHLADYHTKNLP